MWALCVLWHTGVWDYGGLGSNFNFAFVPCELGPLPGRSVWSGLVSSSREELWMEHTVHMASCWALHLSATEMLKQTHHPRLQRCPFLGEGMPIQGL